MEVKLMPADRVNDSWYFDDDVSFGRMLNVDKFKINFERSRKKRFNLYVPKYRTFLHVLIRSGPYDRSVAIQIARIYVRGLAPLLYVKDRDGHTPDYYLKDWSDAKQRAEWNEIFSDMRDVVKNEKHVRELAKTMYPKKGSSLDTLPEDLLREVFQMFKPRRVVN